ncbi:MAG: recombinase family protein [Erysipelotrichales bacterium]|nr:recombinase family protein [Erysipelotrichales bacterium]
MSSLSVIKATPGLKNGVKTVKRVYGYVRVSTLSEMQDTSFVLQADELERHIRSNSDYQFMGIFKDKGTATSLKFRPEFRKMIELAKLGYIDVIITKSISRFARNLVDSITLIQDLRKLNVEIIFQKDNISSLDESFDLLLTILSVHAEEESTIISENNLWSIAARKRKGSNMTARMYGYRFDNYDYEIIESEAKTIRLIFDLYIKGFSYKAIITRLHELGIKSAKGLDYWYSTTIEKMLQNEKYCGDMVLGKTLCKNGKKVFNTKGQTDKYLVSNNHQGIISRETFDEATAIRKSRNFRTDKNYLENKGLNDYYNFVYSSVYNRYLLYVIEKPKGIYQIPTLYCLSKRPGSKRVSIRTEVINKLLEQSYQEIKSFIIHKLDYLKEKLLSSQSNLLLGLEQVIKKNENDKLITNLSTLRKEFLEFDDFSIKNLRKLFRKVLIDDSAIHVKIQISDADDNSINNCEEIHSFDFTYLKANRPTTIPIIIHLESL